MKKSTFLKAFGLLSLLFVFAACNKYEEGSNFSLISAKGRLANTWTISSITYQTGGNTTTITGTSGTVTINKDGTWASSITYTVFGAPITDNDAGTWQFNDDKTQVIMTDNENGDVTTATIIKLKNKELTLTTTDSNGGITRTEYTGS
ncbi:lipocalin family protein [Crocinitomicaceae bacterium]|nr:lipocalin family protein [Crocinitomicaceae bacterium]MDC0257698.1 lipocalin family protein [Crocinitomicaceae bacterium]